MTTTTLNQGLFRREDESLRQALTNQVTIYDRDNQATRQVPAYHRMGTDDARLRVYPYVLIDNLGISRDPAREHRGHIYIDGVDYFPMGVPEGGAVARAEWPIPMLMRYQVATYARFEQHDRQIVTGLMMTPPLRPRFGALDIIGSRINPDDSQFAPADFSVRRVDILDGPTPQDANDQDGKRLFSQRWSIEISTEFFPSEFDQLGIVETVVIDPATEDGFDSLT